MTYGRILTFILFIGLGIFQGACTSKKKVYIMKEKVIVKPSISTFTDQFLTQKAFGKVSVLFVVDNSDSFDKTLGLFENKYKTFLNKITTDPAAAYLDYRVQTVTTPGSIYPKAFVHDKTLDGHLNELFVDPRYLSGYEKMQPLKPFQSAKAALTSPAFAHRAFSPLFVVFVVGEDSDPYDLIDVDQLEGAFGSYQTHFFTLTNIKNLVDCTPAAPQSYQIAANLLKEIDKTKLPENHKYQLDLCDPSWGDLENTLLKTIIDFKKRYVLSRVPYMPQGMRLEVGSRGLAYNVDYEFKADTNEIIFKDHVAAGIPDGSLVKVQYFLGAPEGDLNHLEP